MIVFYICYIECVLKVIKYVKKTKKNVLTISVQSGINNHKNTLHEYVNVLFNA